MSSCATTSPLEDRERDGPEAEQAHQLKHGRAGIEEHGAVRLDPVVGRLGDGALGLEVLLFAHREGGFGLGPVGDAGAAMRSADHALLFQHLEIATHCRQRRADSFRQRRNRAGALGVEVMPDGFQSIALHAPRSNFDRS